MPDLLIRRGIPSDVPRLTGIYNEYVRDTPITFDIAPWTIEERRRDWFDLYASTGRYQLFVAEEDPEAVEAQRQEGIAHDFFANGNLYYWTTLSLIIVAAVIQGEFYERRFGGGPTHLDKSIAVPQGLRRGTVAAGFAILFAYLVDNNEPWGYALVAGMLTLWAIYGVYRTIVQARAPKEYTDLV